MPSSTSSSDPLERVPGRRWSRIWIPALVLAVAVMSLTELYWRANGHRPSIVDDPSLWAFHRRRVGSDPAQVVVLGASRVQLGFSTRVFHERCPAAPLAMLPIDGRYPIAVLRDLARDSSFRGVVICATTAKGFDSRLWDDQQEYVDTYNRMGLNQILEPVLRCWLQDRLVVLNPNVRLVRLLKFKMGDGRLPDPIFIITKFDRSRLADYTLTDAAERRRKRLERVRRHLEEHPSPESWSTDALAVAELVRKIQGRGGAVVFVRYPTTGEHWEIDEQVYPRSNFWDRLEDLTGAKTLHFRDYPPLASFDCPDASHLDYRDAEKFTAALLEELVLMGVLSKAK